MRSTVCANKQLSDKNTKKKQKAPNKPGIKNDSVRRIGLTFGRGVICTAVASLADRRRLEEARHYKSCSCAVELWNIIGRTFSVFHCNIAVGGGFMDRDTVVHEIEQCLCLLRRIFCHSLFQFIVRCGEHVDEFLRRCLRAAHVCNDTAERGLAVHRKYNTGTNHQHTHTCGGTQALTCCGWPTNRVGHGVSSEVR